MQSEYLLTNKLGSYSSSNMLYGPQSRYHGLLVVKDSNGDLINTVTRLEEQVVIGETVHYLNTNQYKDGVVFPKGHEQLVYHCPNNAAHPNWLYQLGADVFVYKSIGLDQTANRLTVRYNIINSSSQRVALKVTPLVAMRRADTLHIDGESIAITIEGNTVVCSNSTIYCTLTSNTFAISKCDDTYYNFELNLDKEKGYDSLEHLSTAAKFSVNAKPYSTTSAELSVAEGTNSDMLASSDLFADRYTSYKNDLIKYNKILDTPTLNRSLASAPNFLTAKSKLIAGYHWFDEWGRDTFISLPGLVNNTEVSHEIITKWLATAKNGIISNVLKDNNYNSIDGTFWLFVAAYKIHTKSALSEKMISMLIECAENLFWTLTRDNHLLDTEITSAGFINDISSGGRTWMDAKVDGVPVTPRNGMAVEIQALWYNFLRITLFFKKEVHDTTFIAEMSSLAAKIERNFQSYFLMSEFYLTDCIVDGSKATAMRPNQIIALSLPFKLLGKRISNAILTNVRSALYTEIGLKSLSETNPAYQTDYNGNQAKRDMAYHNGMVWPFMLGLYWQAVLSIGNYNKKSQALVAADLASLDDYLSKNNQYNLAEIYTPDTLLAQGCIAQAWSYATILETLKYIKR